MDWSTRRSSSGQAAVWPARCAPLSRASPGRALGQRELVVLLNDDVRPHSVLQPSPSTVHHYSRTVPLASWSIPTHPSSTYVQLPRNERRTFVTTSSIHSTTQRQAPSHRTELVSSPNPSSLRDEEDEDEPELDLLPPEEAVLEMTDRAAEQLRSIAQREGNPAAALRVSVESGGCHGYQYKLVLAQEREPDDYQFSHPHIKPSNIYVDAVSMTLLKGSIIDFATELIGSSFRVVDNPQAKGSGCGCGVSWELKL